MKPNLKILNNKVLSELRLIGEEAHQSGFSVYLVGGVVRDLILKCPSLDWDIVVEGRAIELAQAVALRAKAKITKHEQFKTATVLFQDGSSFDFATARSETYPHPGALPVIQPGTIKEDLLRRDFTVNALALNLNPSGFGELIDLYGGLADLRQKKIRVLHDLSFVDDPTRILRAVRFAARLGFQLEDKTLRLLKLAIAGRALTTVKPPRYFGELRKFFSETFPARGLIQLNSLKGFHFFPHHYQFPSHVLSKVEKSISGLKKNKLFEEYDWASVYLLAFLSLRTPEQILADSKYFHLTSRELISLKGLADYKVAESQLSHARLKPSQVYEILDPLDLEIIYFLRALTSVTIVARRIDRFLGEWRCTSLKITGQDLKSLGIKPGETMGALLHALLLDKIDGKIKTHQEEIHLAKQMAIQIIGE